jgi:xanthine/uracil permease
MGLLPILVPGVYSQFPHWAQMVLGNGLAAGTITAVIVNAAFLFGGLHEAGSSSHAEATGAEG